MKNISTTESYSGTELSSITFVCINTTFYLIWDILILLKHHRCSTLSQYLLLLLGLLEIKMKLLLGNLSSMWLDLDPLIIHLSIHLSWWHIDYRPCDLASCGRKFSLGFCKTRGRKIEMMWSLGRPVDHSYKRRPNLHFHLILGTKAVHMNTRS